MEEVKSFVCTSDDEVRKKLLEAGFMEIKNTNGVYTFLFNKKINFAIDEKKIKYTNTLSI